MRRLLRVLVQLYPARWRERYDDEFRSLLDDCTPRLGDLFDVLRGGIEMQVKYWNLGKTFTAFVVVGALVGLAIAASRPERYVSKAVLEQRIGSDEVLKAFRKATDGALAKMRADIRVVRTEAGMFEVSFRSSDATQAQTTHAALVRRLIDVGKFELVESPRTSQEPVGPMYGLAIISGIAGGLMLSTAAALWRRFGSRAST